MVPGLCGLWTLTSYDAPLARVVKQAKYGSDRALMVQLGQVFASRLAPAIKSGPFSAIVPAPSPWTRRVQRGFSPAAVLAKAVARQAQLPLIHALSVTPGPMQASLDARRRRTALAGRLRAVDKVSGIVLLVDDIATTGATLDACCRELLGSGATAVWAATVCVRRASENRRPQVANP
jgi:predicted amidophosphoribosyltransferase